MWRWLMLVMLAGCAGDVRARVTVKPPARAPAPVEERARPAARAETKVVPLRAKELGIEAELALASDGLPARESTAVGDLAAALATHGDVELAAVAAHVAATDDAAADEARSTARATGLIDALAARGVDKQRLRPDGSRCRADLMDIVVLRRSGKDTGAAVVCP